MSKKTKAQAVKETPAAKGNSSSSKTPDVKTPEQEAAEKDAAATADEVAEVQASTDIAKLQTIASTSKRGPVVDAAQKRFRLLAAERKRANAKATIGTYVVSFGELKWQGQARDADEARARFNDAHKTSYGPKTPGWIVEKVPEESDPE